jgi:mannose-6-phosphate isomerase-like protein (cupin superfamily)
MDKLTIQNSIENKKVLFLKGLVSSPISWDIFYSLLRSEENEVKFQFFGGFTAHDSEKNNDYFKDVASYFESLHPGKKIAVMSIVHFSNRTNNHIPKNVQEMYEYFLLKNPNKAPNNFDMNMLSPSRHSDAADGFFLQCQGETLWRVYNSEEDVEVFIASPGDVLFIPKGVEHSVESLSVRGSISVSFND